MRDKVDNPHPKATSPSRQAAVGRHDPRERKYPIRIFVPSGAARARGPSSLDGYTCRTKIAVTPSPSANLPKLMDTESAPFDYVTSCNAHSPATEITRHAFRDIFRRNSSAINKTAKIPRHVFAGSRTGEKFNPQRSRYRVIPTKFERVATARPSCGGHFASPNTEPDETRGG
jgi:hypothetical protein